MCSLFFPKQCEICERRSKYFNARLVRGWEIEFKSHLINCETCFQSNLSLFYIVGLGEVNLDFHQSK